MNRERFTLNVLCSVLMIILISPNMISLSSDEIDVVDIYQKGENQQTEFGLKLGATLEEVKDVFRDPVAGHRSMEYYYFYTYYYSGREIEVCFYQGKMVMLRSTVKSNQTKRDVITKLNKKCYKENNNSLSYLLIDPGKFNESYTRLNFLFDKNHWLNGYQLYNGLYFLEV